MRLYKKKYDLLSYTLLFSGLGCFSYFFIVNYTNVPSGHHDSLSSFQAFSIVVLIFNFFGYILLYVNEKIGVKALSFPGNKANIALYILLIGTFLFFLNYVIVACIKWMAGLHDPFILQTHGIQMFSICWLVQLIMVGQIVINNFYKQLTDVYRKASELEESAAQVKYQALQSQLNPHFLFNSLNTLISEIEYNPKNATLFTHHLSDVYRYILQENNQQLTTLQSELDFLQSYLFLHQARLGDCILMQSQIGTTFLEMKVPPLTLQLLIENVIKHNIISLTKPMTIDISVEEQNRVLVVSNQIRIKKTAAPSGKGLKNLSERYFLLCEKNIEIENDDQQFTVKVPLLQ